jgi:hypothetical protein
MSRWYGALADWLRARSRRERIVLAAVPAVLVLVVAGVLVAGGGGGEGRWLGGNTAAAPAEESGGDSGVGTKPEQAANRPDPVGPTGAPPPYVHSFADQPGAEPRAPLPSPTAALDIAEGTDGCDHAYGGRDVCVPWKFPSGVTDKCAWLRERGFEPLEITGGRDRHGLDRNGDGTACGTGD